MNKIMKEINGKKYSDDELIAIYKFFTDRRDDISLPSYRSLREVGFDKDSKECIDLEDTYKKLAQLDRIMAVTNGKAYELVTMYKDFKRCLPLYIDANGGQVATPDGWKIKELEECNDQEILESIQKLYDKYIETKNESFMKSLRNIIGN